MFFPGGDNPSLNMMNASFTEEDTLCGKGLCISTGKHILRGGLVQLCGAPGLFPRNLGTLGTAIGAKPALPWGSARQKGTVLHTTAGSGAPRH